MQERRGHYTTHIATDLFRSGEIHPAKMDFSTRGLWLPAEPRHLVPSPVHAAYPFTPGFTVPVMSVDETVAEKLGRWQERALVRDLYDLAALAPRVADPQLVAQMWVLKRHTGMTSGPRRGAGPAASVDDLTARRPSDRFALDDLVLPTDPPDHAKRALVEENLAKVDGLCRTIAEHMTPDLYCFAADRGALSWEVRQEIAKIRDRPAAGRSIDSDQGGHPSIGW